jgi:HEAT repeat protein
MAAAVCLWALGAEAQEPAPTPAVPAPPRVEKEKPSKPAPTPKVYLIPEDELFGLEIAPLAPLAPLPPLSALPPLEPLTPLMHLPELPDLPDLAELPDLPDLPELHVVDLESAFHLDELRSFDLSTPPVPDIPDVPAIASAPAIAWAPMTDWPAPGASGYRRQIGEIASDPPQAWAQSDPADSLYRLARQTLNRGEYRRAAQLFGDISQRFPNSAYAADARYWKAFSLYRIGTANDLREALRALESDNRRFHTASLQTDAATLAARIRGALAQLGDVRARTTVETTAAQQGEPCDKEDVAVRVAALSSLSDMDRESTTPILKRILAKRDTCSTGLRRNALFMLGKRGDPEATAIIIAAARNDSDRHVRAEALRWLARMQSDQAIATLEEIARTPGDESMQQAAVSALARSESPRARQSIRNLIERSDVSETLRATALSSIGAEESPDGGAYIRAVYPRLESPRLKSSALRAIARIGGPENDQWLLNIVRNQSEPLDIRTMALSYAGRSAISIGDLVRMYDAAGDRPLRERLISLYARRTEPQATDKLLAIAKSGTDPEMRRLAISGLSKKNDPRTKQLLLEIIDK